MASEFYSEDLSSIGFSEDIRIQELQSVKAIYSNTTHINYETLSGSVHIPVKVEEGISIKIYDASDKMVKVRESASEPRAIREEIVNHLPPIKLTFRFTEKYPYDEPLQFQIFSKFLPSNTIRSLHHELQQLWEDSKDQVLFSIIDLLQDKVQNNLKEMVGNYIDCSTRIKQYEEILMFNKEAFVEEFNSETFTCEICQDDVKGINCSKFDSCGHIFCNNCSYSFFISLIKTGDIDKVHCPNFECNKRFLKTKEKYLRLEDIDIKTFNYHEFKNRFMTPPISLELLTKILKSKSDDANNPEELVKRYYELFVKQQNEVIAKMFPSRTVSCPRIGCPEQIFREDLNEQLVVCPRCKYAFCNRCHRSWHGSFIKCHNDVKNDLYSGIPVECLELWLQTDVDSKERLNLGYSYGKKLIKRMANEYLMDKMFKEMLNDKQQGLRRCPTCEIIIQRLDGCNKMCCSACQTFFCNLCGCYLPYDRPYDHFKDYDNPCYGKLFEGMPGLEDDQ